MSHNSGIADYQKVFGPREYLKTYYSDIHVTDDEAIVAQHLTNFLKDSHRRWSKVLEVGCGPTIHHAFPLAKYVEQIHLSDYLPQNLEEVRKWLADSPDAHDWSHYLQGILALNGEPDTAEQIAQHSQLLRSKVTTLRTIDLLNDLPLGERVSYDLVTSFYTAECVARDHTHLRSILGRMTELVAPGGTLYLVSVRNCSHYMLGDQPIPATPVNEDDLRAAFRDLGFADNMIHVEAIDIRAWEDHGFSGIVISVVEKAETPLPNQ